MLKSEPIAQRMKRIELLLLDIDGTLTEGSIVVDDDGKELKLFHVRDGLGLRYWREAGKRAAVISGRPSPLVLKRAGDLGLSPVLVDRFDKRSAFAELLTQTGLQPEQICAIGDDLPDIPLLRMSGIGVAVADAAAEVKADADLVTHAVGGRGAVREVIEQLLHAQGLWTPLLQKLRGETIGS